MALGLSPRVRGHLNRFRASRTCALPGRSVYPRVCGGTSTQALKPLMALGLSPRVRGHHVNFGEFELTR